MDGQTDRQTYHDDGLMSLGTRYSLCLRDPYQVKLYALVVSVKG